MLGLVLAVAAALGIGAALIDYAFFKETAAEDPEIESEWPFSNHGNSTPE